MRSDKIKICLTGGPSAGKTTALDLIRREFSTFSTTIPEAASILYKGGFPREISGTHPEDAARCAQRAIYFTQVQMEKLFESKQGPSLIFCDRGTLDHPAYWPGSAKDFFEDVGTTVDVEVARYDFVIHLQTAAKEHGYDETNIVRRESPEEAASVDQRILESWKPHPRRVIIPSTLAFHDKITTVFRTVEKLLEGHPEFQRSAQNLRSRFSEFSVWSASP
jgi:predicted ATPase